MKYSTNFTNTDEDYIRFNNAQELSEFISRFGCSGVELMHFDYFDGLAWDIPNQLINGLHLVCKENWLELPREEVMQHYAHEIDFAFATNAPYMVIHASYCNMTSGQNMFKRGDDIAVLDALSQVLNELLAKREPGPWLLLENLWWPGLNLLNPETTLHLVESIEYPRCGIMLDTGHYMHTDLDIDTQEKGIAALNAMLDKHEKVCPEFTDYIRGIHLQQSLTGERIRELRKNPPVFSEDPNEKFSQVCRLAFDIDRHQPFDCAGVRELVDRISPEWVTLEYLTGSCEQLEEYLLRGAGALGILPQ